MSVLTKVEAKSTKGILFQSGVFLALVIGGVTMVYPFLLMVSGSLRSDMDAADLDLVPDYMTQDQVLVRKFLETKYNYDVASMNRMRGYQDYSFRLATLPDRIVPQRVEDLQRFVQTHEIPDHWWMLGGTELYQRTASANLTRFTDRVRERYADDLAALGQDLGSPLRRWAQLSMRFPEWTLQRYNYEPSPYHEEYFALLHERPLAERAFVSVTGTFLENIISPEYGTDRVDEYNLAHVQPIECFTQYALPRRVPDTRQTTLRQEWLLFVGEVLNSSYVRTDAGDADFQAFLNRRYGDIDLLNERWNTSYPGFSAVSIPGEHSWIPAAVRQDFGEFLLEQPPESLYLVGPEYTWREWLRAEYGSLEALNRAHEASYASFVHIPIPMPMLEYQHVLDNTRSLRWEYALRNFRNVLTEVVVQGRPFVNTMIFVGLSLILTLTLQPLAAYALSRFQPRGMWKIILIFMATMAFPPMVGMIPQFLILRQLNLLNTFVALVLPVIVNGYLIFLLKGFFDSLPQHLYEAALIDGASELRMFWEVTMALSKPILAVVALQTFRHAWMMFMYPLLVAPQEEMHVLAVWLHQFQQQAPTSAVFASIVVTSLPTLAIFLFTQRTIMRGIAVPSEK